MFSAAQLLFTNESIFYFSSNFKDNNAMVLNQIICVARLCHYYMKPLDLETQTTRGQMPLVLCGLWLHLLKSNNLPFLFRLVDNKKISITSSRTIQSSIYF